MKDLHLEKLDLNIVLRYAKGYLLDLPCFYIHELSHWLMTNILCIMSFGQLLSISSSVKITRKYSVETNEFEGYTVYGWAGHVTHGLDTYCKMDNFASMLVSIAPAITTLILLWFMPWYVCIFILMEIDYMWASRGDVIQVITYFKKGYTNEDLYMKRKLDDMLCKTQRLSNLKKEII